ncbi:pirin family protein [uncultured Brevundimonas sp.]|uniref:pirin family protein n=1 Tax=uncultured Brevundimonas sp. TaxID=213418 RepID=UPI00262DF38B|nr:pirin family protein [uncultured Brevundimonas sp.]
MTQSVISTKPLESPWQGLDPFLFAVHHVDNHPAGDGRLGIKPEDRAKEGQGWRMYHGEHVPGFPAHPHRGFETVSIVLKGYVDHADSLGVAARYGQGDVQWLTTGGGVEHGEMFPLIHTDKPNTMEMFQIWLNLPPEGKSAKPDFEMFWAENIPVSISRPPPRSPSSPDRSAMCVLWHRRRHRGLPIRRTSWPFG